MLWKKEEKKNAKKTYFAYWTGHKVSCSRNMNFVKYRVSETSEETFFNVWYFFFFFFFFPCIFCAFFALGPVLLIRLSLQNTSPYILIFSCSDHPPPPSYTAIFFLDPPPENILPPPPPPPPSINKWSHRSCSFLNILLFKLLPQSC